MLNHTLMLPQSRKSKRVPDWPGPEKRHYKRKCVVDCNTGLQEDPPNSACPCWGLKTPILRTARLRYMVWLLQGAGGSMESAII